MKNIIIASSSSIYGGDYLEYLLDELVVFFKTTSEILFIPYARPSGISYNEYTNIANNTFKKINKKIIGIHNFKDQKKAIIESKGIFIGGGNTFVLLNQLYKNNLINTLKATINNGTPYLGSSAGSNICGLTIKTTNDMPIVYPPSFNALKLVPFNINPHYQETNSNNKHMGETRTTRIKEFHKFNTPPVIGLREGSWLSVKDKSILLKGKTTAKIFEHNKTPYEVQPETELNHIN